MLKMIKPHYVLFWASGLSFGVAIGAYIACPVWYIAVPLMLLLTVVFIRIGFAQKKKQEEGE